MMHSVTFIAFCKGKNIKYSFQKDEALKTYKQLSSVHGLSVLTVILRIKIGKDKSFHMSPMVHQAGTSMYPAFSSIKWPGCISSLVPIYTLGWREGV